MFFFRIFVHTIIYILGSHKRRQKHLIILFSLLFYWQTNPFNDFTKVNFLCWNTKAHFTLAGCLALPKFMLFPGVPGSFFDI